MQQEKERILFLKSFAKELVQNSLPKDYKPRQQTQVLTLPITAPVKSSPAIQSKPRTQEVSWLVAPGSSRRIPLVSPINRPVIPPKTPPPAPVQNSQLGVIPAPETKTPKVHAIEIQETPRIPSPRLPTYKPVYSGFPDYSMNLSPEFDLGKLNALLNDNRVTIIECPGPDKQILTRVNGIQKVTQISLNEQEIKSIIEMFSRESKIPVIGGLFKVAIGNLMITAVISEVIGTKFVITKINPQFVIEQINQGY